MSDTQRPGAVSEPRHRRNTSAPGADEPDPFQSPDPVEEQLRRWRQERANGEARAPMPDSARTIAGEAVTNRPSGPVRAPGSTATSPDRGEYGASPKSRNGRPVSTNGHVPDSQSRPDSMSTWARAAPIPGADSVTDPAVATPRETRPAPNPPESFATAAPPTWAAPPPRPAPVGPSTSDPLRPGRDQPPRPPAARPQPQASYREDVGAVADARTRSSDEPPAIVASGLHKRFKDMVAVEEVSFTVARGSIVAILGPNGAGKTTTVNMLCTLLQPDKGSASVYGHDVVSDAAAVRRSIMLTGQFAALDEALTGRENLVLFGRLLGLSKAVARARADELLEMFSLTDAGAKRVGQYSGGMRRRIDIACGLVTEPKVVFLDEPTTGLDPRSRQEVWALVERLKSDGVTILLTTQYLEEADVLADNIVVIDKGRVIAEGSSDQLKQSTGAAYCEVTPTDSRDLGRLRKLFADLIGPDAPAEDDHVVSVPAPLGPETLVEVIRRTTDAGIALSDVAMRRPSLDEVFLALTDPRRDRAGS
ncbi:ATP-binding cassette domain-containing protein [Gordonia sp. N1V]|uniref:ATP-binding cassette domain-containing protein n=1 Tax=Gordonia sp. N1V TaxID=3034163 RepID=UPI0023E34AB8|nr:ATP-binding cassette domain-containing protein [Gordonia sp. N1V]MDF3282255.1 ATP-binding cassette domain-containing protein [Gordonia sp. N1V]